MDYSAFLALAADYDTTSVTLSGDSVALLLCFGALALNREIWSENGEPLSDAQWDTINALVAEALGELMP